MKLLHNIGYETGGIHGNTAYLTTLGWTIRYAFYHKEGEGFRLFDVLSFNRGNDYNASDCSIIIKIEILVYCVNVFTVGNSKESVVFKRTLSFETSFLFKL